MGFQVRPCRLQRNHPRSGLAKNYDEVSAKPTLSPGIDPLRRCRHQFRLSEKYQLTPNSRARRPKSHGLCRTPGEIANLPASEIYWVLANA
jgi:hypothetical protein